MKNVVSFAFFAILAISFTSCTKTKDYVDPTIYGPQINASIYRIVNQPTDAVLGESSASFGVGDKIVVYVPYQIANDEISEADLIITDDQGEINLTNRLMISYDPVADGLNVPDELQGTQFMYGVINVEDFYANKNLKLSLAIRGTNGGYSTDQIENAMTIFP